MILGIDPGTRMSGFVIYDSITRSVVQAGKVSNRSLRAALRLARNTGITQVAIERFASYGKPIGESSLTTIHEAGRMYEILVAQGYLPRRVFRREVKKHLGLRNVGSGDAAVRGALIARTGLAPKDAIGTKAAPGPLYGVVGDAWAALAVAITASEETPDKRHPTPRKPPRQALKAGGKRSRHAVERGRRSALAIRTKRSRRNGSRR